MDLQLTGRKALVTGGTRGIGAAIVEMLAAEGVRVAFCARSEEEILARVDLLGGKGYDVAGRALDVGDGEALAAWVADEAAEAGGIDIVVANVSALAIGPGEENWKASFEVDLMHTVRMVEAAMPHLEASDAASVIAVSSVSGREIDFADGSYGVMKAALVHYVSGLALDLAPKGIRANAVSPGNTYFDGGVWQGIEQGNPELWSTALGLNPTGRMGTPEEVAYAVVMLASPLASRISGTNLVVDGALTRGVQL
ncbi:SDR family NAD(P)-dependent oxidoreductase [Pseudonocardia benzenivorans]|jgi:NAD(P)-dependent dehydrogenase (short-subunit alcohol dehydrogenase family)|uniref:3-oxoacyl-(Acyl-carrier-protein) reductase n=2 Tax=Pseudonocardia TaxID=1847 RepID=F4CT00_PSEUX|nr:SDR family oxidoreductase [Pseudonocardia dioxanivorans]AEA25299.1 3-oxoacyl-(acyl-carrier-protein) reductase [Pseudonocardia dioxanivorans CB1190]GJF03729.1 3-ketoacyl-ACP reductase [Pseudonocardia sp. D17]